LPLDPPIAEGSTSSEAQVLSEIVTWSADCPAWQRDALRRLCSKDKLGQSDLDDLLEICKGEKEGSPITADRAIARHFNVGVATIDRIKKTTQLTE
jgi:hypothetical protein